MTANNPECNVEGYPVFETKTALLEHIRDMTPGCDPSRRDDLIRRLSGTDSSVWPDSRAVVR